MFLARQKIELLNFGSLLVMNWEGNLNFVPLNGGTSNYFKKFEKNSLSDSVQKSTLFSVISKKISTETALFLCCFSAPQFFVFSAVQRFSGNEQP